MKIQVSTFMALAMYTCVSLKIFSYVHVNKTCRKLEFQSKYPDIIENDSNHGKTMI